jgi:hypothetical protein
MDATLIRQLIQRRLWAMPPRTGGRCDSIKSALRTSKGAALMKLRDVTRTYEGAVTHVWPPQLLVQIGPMIVQPGEGVLKSVKRFGNRLSLTVEHEGQEAWGGVEVEQAQRPSVEAVERVLKASVGKAIKEIGNLDVG